MNEKMKELLTKLKEKNLVDYNKAGEIITFLKEARIKFIGNDLRFWSTNVGSPSIMCDNIMIVGEK